MGIRRALELLPDDVDALRLGALTALAINQTVTAHQRIDRAIALSPMTAEIANIQGRVLKASGEWAAAEEAYDLALKLDPKFKQAYRNRLNLFTISEQPRRVLESLDGRYDYGDMGEIARVQALTDLGRYEEALNILDVIEISDFADRIIYQRLKCLHGLGRLEEMKDVFAQLSTQSELYPKALTIILNGLEMRGERAASMTQLEKALEISNPSGNLQAVRLLRRLEGDQSTYSKLQTILGRYPENIETLCDMAEAARLGGKADESCEIYQRALTLRPGDYKALSGFAQAAIVAGKLSDAQVVLQGALNQAPNNQFLLALVATLLRQMGGAYNHLYDYKNFIRVYDLEPPNDFSTIVEFNHALKAKLEQLHVYKNAPLNQSLRKGTQTETDLSLIDDPVLQAFFMAIDEPIRDYIEKIGRDHRHPLSRRNRGNYRIQGAWSVRLQGGGHHVNHVHPMGWISSAYYVDLPKIMSESNKEGWIKFGESNLNLNETAEHYVQPKQGRLVLFPSYMWHGTVPFTGQDTRLTLPFDVVPA